MRTFSITGITIILILLCALPASADARQRHIEERLDYWIEYAEDHDYYVIENFIDDIRETRTLHFSLAPGEYHVFAQGGLNIDDLDMTALDDDGWELDFDNMADNFPAVTFRLDRWEDIEFEIEVWSFTDWNSSGSFCFVLSREDGPGENHRGRDRGWRDDDRWHDDNWWDDDEWDNNGRGRENRGRGNRHDDDWSFYNDRDFYRQIDDFRDDWSDWWYDWDYDNSRYGPGHSYSRHQRRNLVNDKLGYLHDFADYRGHRPIFDTIEEIEDTLTFGFELDPGYYVVFAAGGPNIDDLDLCVNWVRGYRDREIAEDVGFDSYPAVWFYLPDPTLIEIEVEVYRFEGRAFDDYICLLVCQG